MHVETKKSKFGPLQILRIQESEKEEYVKAIEYAIENLIKPEYHAEIKACTSGLVNECMHDERFDQDGEESRIIQSREVPELIQTLFTLLCITAEALEAQDAKLDAVVDTLETQKEKFDVVIDTLETQNELLEAQNELLNEFRKLTGVFVNTGRTPCRIRRRSRWKGRCIPYGTCLC